MCLCEITKFRENYKDEGEDKRLTLVIFPLTELRLFIETWSVRDSHFTQ